MDTTPTLRTLLGRAELRLRLAGDPASLPDGALDLPLRWVHSSDLLDPTPFLSDGLALLTTGTQFLGADEDPEVYASYVARLRTRGVIGLGFGTEVVRDGIPPLLIDACRARDMPLFVVPYRTPFIAVARAGAEAVAAQAYARSTWALSAQRALSLAALRPDGLGATLNELSRQLDTWVGLFDANGTLTREHPAGGLRPEDLDALRHEAVAVQRRGARAASSFLSGETAFTLQTLGRGGHLRGVLAIAADSLDQEGRGVVTAVVAMAGLAFEQQQGLERARAALRAGLIQSMATGDATLARRIAGEMWGGLPAAPLVVGVTDPSVSRSFAAAEWLELKADEAPRSVFFGRNHDALVLVVPAEHSALLEDFARRFDVVLGVSDPAGYSDFPRALDQATFARDHVPAGATNAVRTFADVTRTGMRAALDTADARILAAGILDPLVRHDAAHGTALTQTLRSWLAADCNNEDTARLLGVHRHTVRARITQSAALLGRDLGTFATRAELWTTVQSLDTATPR